MSPYNNFIAKSRYSRYLDDKGRREHWNETVARYFDFMEQHLKDKQLTGISTNKRQMTAGIKHSSKIRVF